MQFTPAASTNAAAGGGRRDRVGLSNQRLCLSFGGDGVLGQEDAVAEEREAGSAVHLAHGSFRLGVHAVVIRVEVEIAPEHVSERGQQARAGEKGTVREVRPPSELDVWRFRQDISVSRSHTDACGGSSWG
ncbi:hypothetical protein Msi02_06110 [Microbispora siamensis]|uniref:Uncharacterized protein n=1 Tax=Microbispora siamensis TaxID=564413 RepID=A0ABQ4GEE4_9ACTN|nr:hypothetical protein Msi02_06110 [Microbispora siamensis]